MYLRWLFLASYVLVPLLLVGILYVFKWRRWLPLAYPLLVLLGCFGYPQLILWLEPPPPDMKCGMPVGMLYMVHWFFFTPVMLFTLMICLVFWPYPPPKNQEPAN